MMKSYDKPVEINHNPNWSYIPDHSCRISIIRGLGSSKNNAFLNLMKHQQTDIDKIYLNVKDPFESRYQLLIKKREKVDIKKITHPKAFIDYWQTTDNVYENLEDYNSTKKKMVIVFHDMIAGMEANKKLSAIVNELFLRDRRPKISLVFISKPYFKLPRTIRLNTTHCFIVK